MKIKTIKKIKNLFGLRVLVRADFNVPVKNGKIEDDFKIRRGLGTIKYLCAKGAKVIVITHLGRPEGADKKLSLKPVALRLEKLLGKKIKFLPWTKAGEYFGRADKEIARMKNCEVLMLENVRFLGGEEENNTYLSRQFSELADIFVLDGFAVAHRASSSVTGIGEILPSYAGILMEEEISGLSRVLRHPKKPLVVVLGGAKMETKMPVLKKLLPVADKILLGGGIANTFFLAAGYQIGSSIVDKEERKTVLKLLKNKKIVLPLDVIVGKIDGKDARSFPVGKDLRVEKGSAIYDLGPATMRLFAAHLKKANTLIWNGAMGLFETHPYEYGTKTVARLFATRSRGKAFGVLGGGETVEVVEKMGLAGEIDLVSTGGGAMLKFLSGGVLPGLEILKR